jgi:hypothetical protein
MNAANSCGVVGRGSAPRFSMKLFMSALARLFTISLFNVFTIAGGVAAGATMPHHEIASKPGTVSAMVGKSGNEAERFRDVTASAASRLLRTWGTTATLFAKLIAI